MLDQDLRRFEHGIKGTSDGLKLLLAMHEGRIALSQIERLWRLGGRQSHLLSWQQAYIKASNRASEALDRLWDTYQWPSDGARDRRFAWHPGEDLRR